MLGTHMMGNETDTGAPYPELIVCGGDGCLNKPLFFEAPMMIPLKVAPSGVVSPLQDYFSLWYLTDT